VFLREDASAYINRRVSSLDDAYYYSEFLCPLLYLLEPKIPPPAPPPPAATPL